MVFVAFRVTDTVTLFPANETSRDFDLFNTTAWELPTRGSDSQTAAFHLHILQLTISLALVATVAIVAIITAFFGCNRTTARWRRYHTRHLADAYDNEAVLAPDVDEADAWRLGGPCVYKGEKFPLGQPVEENVGYNSMRGRLTIDL